MQQQQYETEEHIVVQQVQVQHKNKQSNIRQHAQQTLITINAIIQGRQHKSVAPVYIVYPRAFKSVHYWESNPQTPILVEFV